MDWLKNPFADYWLIDWTILLLMWLIYMYIHLLIGWLIDWLNKVIVDMMIDWYIVQPYAYLQTEWEIGC